MTDQEQTLRIQPEDLENDVAGMSEPEIDIQEIKSRIRQAVARRQAAGQTSFINAAAQLVELLSQDVSASLTHQLQLPPAFTPHDDDHYHINDLLKYHDREFIWNAYRALLKRQPDPEGLRAFMELLRSGRFNKIDVLARLRYSSEGRRFTVSVDGLLLPAMVRRLYRLPVVGYVVELVVSLVRLPRLIRNQRQIENQVMIQREEIVKSFADSLSRLEQQQKAIVEAQHQEFAALFRKQQRASRNGNFASNKCMARDRRLAVDELYASFEKEFRGSAEEIKEGFKMYLPLLKESGITSDILDIGCGRGEWLELLQAKGLQARGVESNRAMIDLCSPQLAIFESDAVSYLRDLPENSLHAVTAFHFVEHIELEELIELLDEIKRTLKPGGLLIIETPNPKNLVVGACNFYSDPTHRKPLFPETLAFILNHRGFVRTQLEYIHPVDGSPFRDGSEAAEALNSWLFSARDFSIVARSVSP